MKIKYHKEFLKNYKKRITSNTNLSNKFKEQLEKFINNPQNPALRDHKLIGKKQNFRAFSITGNIRVVYKIMGDELWFYDIGSHNQVY